MVSQHTIMKTKINYFYGGNRINYFLGGIIPVNLQGQN